MCCSLTFCKLVSLELSVIIWRVVWQPPAVLKKIDSNLEEIIQGLLIPTKILHLHNNQADCWTLIYVPVEAFDHTNQPADLFIQGSSQFKWDPFICCILGDAKAALLLQPLLVNQG